MPDWPVEAKVRQVPKVEGEDVEMETESIRINIFKRYCAEEEWETAVKKPIEVIGDMCGVEMEARAYGWRMCGARETLEGKGEGRGVMGYVKVKKGTAEALLGKAGMKGVFFARLASDKTDKLPVRWIKKEEGESDKQYYERCMALARAAGKALVYRTGGGSCLGIRGQTLEKSEYGSFVMYGAPQCWGPDKVRQWMKHKGGK